MRILPRTDPRPIHPESPRTHMACQMSAMQRMPSPAERQMLRPQWSIILQGGFFQVSRFPAPNSVLTQSENAY